MHMYTYYCCLLLLFHVTLYNLTNLCTMNTRTVIPTSTCINKHKLARPCVLVCTAEHMFVCVEHLNGPLTHKSNATARSAAFCFCLFPSERANDSNPNSNSMSNLHSIRIVIVVTTPPNLAAMSKSKLSQTRKMSWLSAYTRALCIRKPMRIS